MTSLTILVDHICDKFDDAAKTILEHEFDMETSMLTTLTRRLSCLSKFNDLSHKEVSRHAITLLDFQQKSSRKILDDDLIGELWD